MLKIIGQEGAVEFGAALTATSNAMLPPVTCLN